ncbi:hypothetical protein [Dactylosporangium sp. NPDC000521]|uniref:hypothetical protein n=1 Tax=Dactylosporangium sp. NPDC000521 TaxID=3363975 RepID=UPI00367BED60
MARTHHRCFACGPGPVADNGQLLKQLTGRLEKINKDPHMPLSSRYGSAWQSLLVPASWCWRE